MDSYPFSKYSIKRLIYPLKSMFGGKCKLIFFYVNFDKSTIELYLLFKSFMLVKFLKDRKLIVMLSITCLNFNFL